MYQNLDFDILNIPDLPDGTKDFKKGIIPESTMSRTPSRHIKSSKTPVFGHCLLF